MIKRLLLFISILLSGCVSIPENVLPVNGFDVDQYMGTWYEIARLDHSFERGLERVTAEYSLRDDGGIKVINKGFDLQKKRWKEVIGKAYFVDDSDLGKLKVSFWGPFYSSYNIIAKKNIPIQWYAVPINPICGFWQESPIWKNP